MYILTQETTRLELALSSWDCKKYPEARKQRDKKLKDIKKSLELIYLNL